MEQEAMDRAYMAEAIAVSRQNKGQTGSNPSVGCVIVKEGEIVGRGVTARSGRPHAETQALAMAGEAARGATAYVTLEPCSHHGKTPPCADALIAAGIARVVVAVGDPDIRVAGRGLARLTDAGIAVVAGVLEQEARRELEAYLMRQTCSRPFVTLKLAVSADGMIGIKGRGQVAITGPQTRTLVHLLRAETDAILIGIGTALADDPELTCRLEGMEDRSPIRIVLDRRLELPVESKLVQSAKTTPLMIVCDKDISALEADPESVSWVAPLLARAKALHTAGARILFAENLPKLMETLALEGISSLLVEGGARVAASFLAANCVDRIRLHESPLVIGQTGIISPVTKDSISSGFVVMTSHLSGQDTCTIFERESTCSQAL
jgi:diaminohydroxyphosphoribosylaminopyrimidine deaminase / 5-amino-6-(5-phosphoribosylamino)uracil reductase